MRAELKASRYVLAGFFTLAVFLMAFTIGTYMESVRNDVLTDNLEAQRYQIADLLLQYQFIQELAEEGECAALQKVFQESLTSLNVQSERLQSYEGQNKISEEDFLRLRKAYTISQVNYWLLARDLKTTCGMEAVEVLYFFDVEENCPQCEDQGIHLDYVRRVLGDNFLVFALDANSPGVTQMLISVYNITSYPSLVIEDEQRTFSTNEKLFERVCSKGNFSSCPEKYVQQSATRAENET